MSQLTTMFGWWNPIGTTEHPYSGTFDGKGYSINNLYCYVSKNYVGLFGCIQGATLKNFTVSGKLEATSSTEFKAIGGVVGGDLYPNGNSTIDHVINKVNITIAAGVDDDRVGGIVGEAAGTKITYCENHGTIDAGACNESKTVGGIAAYAAGGGYIKNCLNTGAIKCTGASVHLGGILGYINKLVYDGVQHCLNTGQITSASPSSSAIIGTAGAGIDGKQNLYFGNYYLTGKGTDHGYSGAGKLQEADNQGNPAVTNSQLKSGEVCYLLNGETSEGTLSWFQKIGTDNTPVLKSASGNTVYQHPTPNALYPLDADQNFTIEQADVELLRAAVLSADATHTVGDVISAITHIGDTSVTYTYSNSK